METRFRLVLTIVFLAVAVISKAYTKPTAEIVSRDTSFCLSGTATLIVKFTGKSPFGIVYTVTDELNTSTEYSLRKQSTWIPITIDNPIPIFTTAFVSQSKSLTITVNRVYDGNTPMTEANGTEWSKDSGTVVVGQKMIVSVDKMPKPMAGLASKYCGFSAVLNGVKSKATNSSLWRSEMPVSFTDISIEKPTVTVPSQGSYKFWFKEIEGTCKDSAAVTDEFNAYAKASLSGASEVCGNDSMLTILTTEGNYPLTYKYTDGIKISEPIIVNSTTFTDSVWAMGNKIFTIESIVDKNNCLSRPSDLSGSATSVDLTPNPSISSPQIVCANAIDITAIPDAPNGQWVSSDGFFDDINAPSTKFVCNNWGESTISWRENRKGCVGSATQKNEFQKHQKAIAGVNQTLFLENETYLAAEPLDYGMGVWSTTNKSVQIISPALNTTKVLGLAIGATTFQWKVQNGICPPDSDLVVINVKDFTFSGGFTPNGDGINDVFEIFGLIQRPVPNNELKVFDSSGRLVFSQKEYNNSWDGTNMSGEKLPDGAYYFIFSGDGFAPVKSCVIIKSE